MRAKSDKKRIDLTEIDFFTVDGSDAKDFDDAIYVEGYKKGGWRALVAIADVSSYVHSGDPIDQEAFSRGTSVYFPRSVVPMLPEFLSNNLCSLDTRHGQNGFSLRYGCECGWGYFSLPVL